MDHDRDDEVVGQEEDDPEEEGCDQDEWNEQEDECNTGTTRPLEPYEHEDERYHGEDQDQREGCLKEEEPHPFADPFSKEAPDMDIARPEHVDEDELHHRADDPPDERDRKHDEDEHHEDRCDPGEGPLDAGREVAFVEVVPGGVRETDAPSHKERDQGQAEPDPPLERPEQAFCAMERTFQPAECIRLFSHSCPGELDVSTI